MRAFLVVMDSVGIGGAPDADRFFNGDVPDTGSNTVLNIAKACAEGYANQGRLGPLNLPTLIRLGLGNAIHAASGEMAPNLAMVSGATWAAATEQSLGKDTPSGHWELAGLTVPWAPSNPLASSPQVLSTLASERFFDTGASHTTMAGEAPRRPWLVGMNWIR